MADELLHWRHKESRTLGLEYMSQFQKSFFSNPKGVGRRPYRVGFNPRDLGGTN